MVRHWQPQYQVLAGANLRFSQPAHSLEVPANNRSVLFFTSVILNLFQNFMAMIYAKPIAPIKPINPETLTSVRVTV